MSAQVFTKSGELFIVSACDFDRVQAEEWRLWSGYPNSNKVGQLHKFILGDRPSNVPEKYVIDHANRNIMDARRCNLRWVTRGWNSFNTALKKKGTSRFKGVYWSKNLNKWTSSFRSRFLGAFRDEREAAKAYARKAVEFWPEWAPSSDLLVGPELLTLDEMNAIVAECAIKTNDNSDPQRILPVGVQPRGNRFRATYCRKKLGTFDSAEEAGHAYLNYKSKIKAEQWVEHQKLPISRDDEGDAIIQLSGKAAKGKLTKVPDRFWHRLTFKSKWNMSGEYAAGQLDGVFNFLHIIVYRLCHPDEPIIGTIDHVDPAAKLNNLETNLRDATQQMQAHNKQKKANCTSKYIGVSRNTKTGKWIGKVSIKNTRYWTKWMNTEQEAADALKSIKDAKLG